jgi:hypothetical protein
MHFEDCKARDEKSSARLVKNRRDSCSAGLGMIELG